MKAVNECTHFLMNEVLLVSGRTEEPVHFMEDLFFNLIHILFLQEDLFGYL